MMISVIVPVYKVEKYLDKCIDSIVNQTYRDLEIILVDDGSPDRCPQICDGWAEKDSRIKVIHKKNGGLSDARNAGLDVAKGEYIGFVDSDDWISKGMYELMLDIMERTKADLVECGYQKVSSESEVKESAEKDTEDFVVFSTEESLRHLIKEDIFKHTAWNKLYKYETIKSLRFEVGKLHEDVFWSYQVFAKCKAVAKIDICMYCYLQRIDSIMGTAYSLRNLDALEAKEKMYQYIKKEYPGLLHIASDSLFFNSLYLGQKAVLSNDTELRKQSMIIIKKHIKSIKIKHISSSLKDMIWYCLAKVSLYRCCAIRNYLRIGM